MALSPAQRAVLTRRHQQRLAAISVRATAPVDRAWLALGGYRDDDVEEFRRATRSAVAAAKQAAVVVAVGYFSTILSTPPPGINAKDVPTQFNALAPFLAVRRGLAEGYSLERAAEIGRAQAQAATHNLTISTARVTGDVFVEKKAIKVAWERNAEGKSCAWCQRLDGTIYSSAEAADFGHDRCNCTASPIPR